MSGVGCQDVRKAGVIGWPVSHSLSPIIHNYWLEKYGISGIYEKIPVRPEELQSELARLQKEGYAGVNVTIPHKEKVMEFMDEIEEAARNIGAVNTIVFKRGKSLGLNTDWFGFWFSLSTAWDPTSDKNCAVVIGAGGAARAVISVLLNEGFQEVIIVNRTKERASRLKNDVGDDRISICGWDELDFILPEIDLLVNATSLGMSGQPPLEIDIAEINREALVMDIVYNPLRTGLLERAEKLGIKHIGGLDMLIGQAIPAFKAWFGREAEITAELRQLLVAELERPC